MLNAAIAVLVLLVVPLCSLPLTAQSRSAKKPGLIRDTGVAEARDSAPEVKEPDPLLCEKNIKIGDFYFKKKNYEAAISRYLEAIEYQSDSARAFESLARAYEKNKEPDKAIITYQRFIKENPDSPNAGEFRTQLKKLEKSAR
jgi:outer membrane protein assembly factor BamD (BamD/ComL family)